MGYVELYLARRLLISFCLVYIKVIHNDMHSSEFMLKSERRLRQADVHESNTFLTLPCLI